jgi:2',3'-cyclic-nucleotide 2'-phosphodiesterase / 3'-nucleotidase / 5'-nucleotidase
MLKNSANLGRLNITNTMGRNRATGLYEQLFAFGTRSFSIWNASGKLIFDSGDAFERITAETYPSNFNASNTNNTFDNRSDDKGPEPEGVVVGEIFGTPYAFIGLERIGGVIVYDISNPAAPRFVQYVNSRDFTAAPGTREARDLGPEGLLFISARDSPKGRPLLVIGNEISGTTTIFEIRSSRLPPGKIGEN